MSRCDMLLESNIPTADVSCSREATHLVPGTPLGPVAMCDGCFAEWLVDNEGDESGVTYLTHDAFAASLDRVSPYPKAEAEK